MKTILYMEHANVVSGAVLSLLYLIQSLDRSRYRPVVACVGERNGVTEYYQAHGIEAIACPKIGVFPHSTGGWYRLYSPRGLAQATAGLVRVGRSVAMTEEVIERVQPDLIHLNSVILVPSAIAASRRRIPLVWHIRESVVEGHFGIRHARISDWVMRLPTEVIFISSDERRRLVGDARGVVIPDFVDFKRFNRELDGGPCRASLGLEPADRVVLFLGGLNRINGLDTLLSALPRVKDEHPRLQLLVGGGQAPMSRSIDARVGRLVLPLVGRPTDRQRAARAIAASQMARYVHLLPFRSDVEQLLAACDILVAPSLEPHCARPVIEAGAMGKPVVASRIGGVEEMVEDGATGILVPPGNPEELAMAIGKLLRDREMARRLGEGGHERARRLYNQSDNSKATIAIYERILSS